MISRSFVIFNVLFLAGSAFASHWKYDNEEHWTKLCLEGKSQSPVSLTESIAIKKDFNSFILVGYGQINTALLKNNGHSAEVRLHSTAEVPTVYGGGLPGTYKLDHLHFHWQSEHTMSNYRYPLELHLVHYNEKYNNLTEAAQNVHGIAVLGVLFDLSPDDDEDFKPLLEIIANLRETSNEHKQLTDFSVKNFIPRDKAGFYRYEGSLTTPGCNEGVIWTLFTSTLPISKKQVKIFEIIQTEEKSALTKNYRSLQPLNGRKVYLRVSPIRENDADIQKSSVILPISLLILSSFYNQIF